MLSFEENVPSFIDVLDRSSCVGVGGGDIRGRRWTNQIFKPFRYTGGHLL